MKQWVRIALMGTFASALLGLLPCVISPAHAVLPVTEIHLNSSNVQVVKNPIPFTDVLNMSLNVTGGGEGGCDAEGDDLLEKGVHISVSHQSCAFRAFACPGILCAPLDFDAQIDYVEHEIGGNDAYGTSYAPNKLGAVASKIVLLGRPPSQCGTWSINLQATGQDLSAINTFQVALYLNDFDLDGDGLFGPACYDVDVHVGPGIVKPHRGVHRARH
jgi:hypothetical protein